MSLSVCVPAPSLPAAQGEDPAPMLGPTCAWRWCHRRLPPILSPGQRAPESAAITPPEALSPKPGGSDEEMEGERGTEARAGAHPHTYLPSRAAVISKAGQGGQGRGAGPSAKPVRRGALSGPLLLREGQVSSGLPSETQKGKRRGALGSLLHQPPHGSPTPALLRGASSGLGALASQAASPGPGGLLPSVANRCSSTTCSPGRVLRTSQCSLVYLMGWLPGMSLGATVGRGASNRAG